MIIVYIIISPLNSYLYIHWILDFKSILLLSLLYNKHKHIHTYKKHQIGYNVPNIKHGHWNIVIKT